MTDLWEIMGRLVSSAATRKVFAEDAVLTTPDPPVPGGFRYAVGKHNHLTAMIASHVKPGHGPVSISAKGELVRVLPMKVLFEKLDALEKRAKDLGVALTSRSPRFYCCLGALTLDDDFAGEVAVDPNAAFEGGLDANEVKDLKALARDTSGVNAYRITAAQLCEETWRPDCLGRLRPYGEFAEIGHPVLLRTPDDLATAQGGVVS